MVERHLTAHDDRLGPQTFDIDAGKRRTHRNMLRSVAAVECHEVSGAIAGTAGRRQIDVGLAEVGAVHVVDRH